MKTGSTLKPGRRSEWVAKLSEAAAKEMDAVPKGLVDPPKLRFDVGRDEKSTTSYNSDTESWVSKFPGVNSPHVGNGSGSLQ